MTSNENSVLDFSTSHGASAEYGEIFAHMETGSGAGAINGSAGGVTASTVYKRRSSDSYMEGHVGTGNNNGAISGGDWSEYMVGYPMAAKRLQTHNPSLDRAGPPPSFGANHPPNLFDASNGPGITSAGSANTVENSFNNLIEKARNLLCFLSPLRLMSFMCFTNSIDKSSRP